MKLAIVGSKKFVPNQSDATEIVTGGAKVIDSSKLFADY